MFAIAVWIAAVRHDDGEIIALRFVGRDVSGDRAAEAVRSPGEPRASERGHAPGRPKPVRRWSRHVPAYRTCACYAAVRERSRRLRGRRLYEATLRRESCRGVPLGEWLPADRMLAIANEMNLSETAFFVPRGNDYDLRWFTPALEIEL